MNCWNQKIKKHYWKNPARFKFLPGEKASLISTETLCTSLVGKLPLVYISPIIEESTPTFKVKAGRQCTGQQQQSVKNSTIQRTKAVDNGGKTISSYIDDCCSRKGQLVNYGAEHYELRPRGRLFCLTCRKLLRFTLGINGYWKTNMTSHIDISHSLKTQGILLLSTISKLFFSIISCVLDLAFSADIRRLKLIWQRIGHWLEIHTKLLVFPTHISLFASLFDNFTISYWLSMILDKRRSKSDESDPNCGIEKKILAGNS